MRNGTQELRSKYGWSSGRILSGYTQHVCAVHGYWPKGLVRTSPDACNKPKQCYDLVSSLRGHDEALMRKALANEDPLSDDELNTYLDFVDDLHEWLNEHPWEPIDTLEEEPEQVQFDSLNLVAEQTGIPTRTLRNWIGYGMPHRHQRGKFYVQISVVERWNRLKTPKRKLVDNSRKNRAKLAADRPSSSVRLAS